MYDPPQLRMYQMLEQNAPHSPQARGYLERLAALKPDIRKAVTAAERGEPSGAGSRGSGAGRLDALWRDECRPSCRRPPSSVVRRSATAGSGPMPPTPPSRPASACWIRAGRTGRRSMIFHEPDLRIYDMTLSDDARTLFFSAPRNGVEGGWQIYEIGIDGRRSSRSPGARAATSALRNCPAARLSLSPRGAARMPNASRCTREICTSCTGTGRTCARSPRTSTATTRRRCSTTAGCCSLAGTTESRRTSSRGRRVGDEARRDGVGVVFRQYDRGSLLVLDSGPDSRPLRGGLRFWTASWRAGGLGGAGLEPAWSGGPAGRGLPFG